MEQNLPILLCKNSSTHTQHLTLQQYFSHPRLIIYCSIVFQIQPITHEIGIVKGQCQQGP